MVNKKHPHFKVIPNILFCFCCLILLNSCHKDDYKITTIPFSIIKNRMLIKAVVNGTDTLNFIFDTGCEKANLDSAYIVKRKIKPYSFSKIFCPHGEIINPIVKCVLTVNNLSYNLDTCYTLSTNKLSEQSGIKINGVIGRDLYKNYILKIDFVNRLLVLYKKEYVVNQNDYDCLNLYNSASIYAKAILQNEKIIEGQFLIDSGSGSDISLYFPKKDSTDVKLLIGEYSEKKLSDLCGNKKKGYMGQIKSIKIGNFNIDSVKGKLTFANNSNYSGLIGFLLLRKFDIIIDIKKSKLYLKPNHYCPTKFVI
ncbi:MAG: hypothetical protein A2275_09520 [Bacteroidetes bacterium RIFOXYA12_FULL_35_11]|nr:MAG: hypothetical protein A2275_09520 [Bacteroidetes bacterium RIFOXYA12_FULL_35_11]HBX52740.1 hypothetical protein [Bacteroidales bacterium]